MRSTLDRRQVTVALAAAALAPAIALLIPRLSEAQESSPTASPAASPSASPVAGDEIEIGAHDIYFDPKEVTVKADKEMTIKVENYGVTQHTFLIDDHKNENLPFDPIKLVVDPGKTEETKFKAPAGKYYFWCDIPGHESAGMWGYITVK